MIVSKQDANQVLKLAFDDASQSLRITGSSIPGSMTVDQADGSLLHVTVDASALPAGAATEAKQDDQIAQLADIQTAVENTASNGATSANQTTTLTSLANLLAELSAFADKSKSSDVTEAHDYKAFTYVAAGNGVGQVETITYKLGGAAGTTVALQTLTYDAQNRVTSVAKT
jgi:hypothetical protein